MSSKKVPSFGSDTFFWQSIFCDAAAFVFTVFLTNSLSPFLTKEILNHDKSLGNYSPLMGWLCIGTVLAQTTGLLLMRPVIHKQMQSEGAPSYGTASLIGAIFIWIMHFYIFGILLTWDGFKSIWGNVSGFKMIIPIIIIMTSTIATIYISFPGNKKKVLTAKDKWLGWLGTMLITFSVVIVSQMCWYILFDGAGHDMNQPYFILSLILAIFFGFFFLLIYLPPRYGFIITEYNKPSVWIRIALVYAPFGWQILTG